MSKADSPRNNKLLKNLLDIHLLISEMDSFIPIQICIMSLDQSMPAYKEAVRYTEKIKELLTKFSEMDITK
jgi:hypothetical protein